MSNKRQTSIHEAFKKKAKTTIRGMFIQKRYYSYLLLHICIRVLSEQIFESSSFIYWIETL